MAASCRRSSGTTSPALDKKLRPTLAQMLCGHALISHTQLTNLRSACGCSLLGGEGERRWKARQTKYPLVYDLQEPYRWIVDTTVISCLESRSFGKVDFYRMDNYVLRLRPEATRKLVDANIGDYREVYEPIYQLSGVQLEAHYGLTCYDKVTPFQPFVPRNNPRWWDAYNEVKHAFFQNMNRGTLDNRQP